MALQTPLPLGKRKLKTQHCLAHRPPLPDPSGIVECLWCGIFWTETPNKTPAPPGICQPELALIHLTCVFGSGKF